MTFSTPLFGPYGISALKHIERFAQHNANALWFHGFNPDAFDACARHGVSACVEFKTFRADFNDHPELAPIGIDGQPINFGRLVQGVCLSQQDFLDETEAQLLDGLRQFQPAGVWLDYLTYGGWFETPEPDLQESCFCPACIQEFCESTGIDADKPHQILTTAADEWRLHKCERVASYALHYASLIRDHRPNSLVGAYMCSWTPDEFDGALGRIFAQDYQLFAPAIDIFTPLIYVQKSGRLPDWGREFLSNAPAFVPPDRKVQLILDALDFPESLLSVADSTRPSWGIQVFNGAEILEDPDKAAVFAGVVDKIRARL